MRGLVLCHMGRQHVRPQTCCASETTHRLSASPGFVEEKRGPPRLRGRPLRACYSQTPRRIPFPPRPLPQGMVVAFAKLWKARHPESEPFRGRNSTARTFAYLRIAHSISGTGARLATDSGGLTLSRTGFAPAGRQTKFHEGIASSNSSWPAWPGRTKDGVLEVTIPKSEQAKVKVKEIPVHAETSA